MSTTWSTRPVRVEDAALIARHRYFCEAAKEDLAGYERWVAKRIERGVYTGVLAETELGAIAGAGCVVLDWGPTRGEPTGLRGRIVNVYTDPRWRRRGIARSLVQDVMGRCQKRGLQVFGLAATDDSADLYRSLGFDRYPREMILRP
jgi:ribosomal protein S18 acetylase RimI-like enzyme